MIINVLTTITILVVLWYTIETRKMRLGSEEQHRREWQTDYYFAVERHETPSTTDLIRYYEPVVLRQADAVATVANLGRPAILVLGIWLRTITTAGRVSNVRQFRINPIALTSGTTAQFIVADFIVKALIDIAEIPSSTQQSEQKWQGLVELGALVFAEGEQSLGEGRIYDLEIAYGAVRAVNVSPSLPLSLA